MEGGGGWKFHIWKNNLMCRYFNINDLDAFFLVTNAPGRSAFNSVERRMASFSKELGVLLKHEDFGAHLDDKGNTIDPQPKLKNFEHAGKIFAKFGVGWSSMTIQ